MGACQSLIGTISCLNHVNIGCHRRCVTALYGAQPCDCNIDTHDAMCLLSSPAKLPRCYRNVCMQTNALHLPICAYVVVCIHIYIHIYIYIYTYLYLSLFLSLSLSLCIYIYIYIYAYTYATPKAPYVPTPPGPPTLAQTSSTGSTSRAPSAPDSAREDELDLMCRVRSGGHHLSDTTCLTHVFFKSREYCSKLN